MTRTQAIKSAIRTRLDEIERMHEHDSERRELDAALIILGLFRGRISNSEIATAINRVFGRKYTKSTITLYIRDARKRRGFGNQDSVS